MNIGIFSRILEYFQEYSGTQKQKHMSSTLTSNQGKAMQVNDTAENYFDIAQALTQQAIKENKLIELGWVGYYKTLYPGGMAPMQEQQIMESFFGGAATLIGILNDLILSVNPGQEFTEEHHSKLDKVMDELQVFNNELEKKQVELDAKEGKLIAKSWVKYGKFIFPNGMIPIQEQHLMESFYSGASYLISALVLSISAGQHVTNADVGRLESIVNELQTFTDGLNKAVDGSK